MSSPSPPNLDKSLSLPQTKPKHVHLKEISFGFQDSVQTVTPGLSPNTHRPPLPPSPPPTKRDCPISTVRCVTSNT